MTNSLIALGIGLTAGVLGGVFGIGGGVIIVPALVLLLHTSQHTAVGTSLGALLPPVGILGTLEYYRRGQVNLGYAFWIGLGLLIGAYVGSLEAGFLSDLLLRRMFGVLLLIIAVRLLFP